MVKRLYEYARKGETVERPTRQITIHSLELLDELKYMKAKKLHFLCVSHVVKDVYSHVSGSNW